MEGLIALLLVFMIFARLLDWVVILRIAARVKALEAWKAGYDEIERLSSDIPPLETFEEGNHMQTLGIGAWNDGVRRVKALEEQIDKVESWFFVSPRELADIINEEMKRRGARID